MSIAAKDDVAVDADLLRDQVKSKYREVATDPHGAHHFHTGRCLAAQQAAPVAPAALNTVTASQLGYLVPPNPIYPARARRAGEQGNAVRRVLVDVTGRPAQVLLQTSSGYPELD